MPWDRWFGTFHDGSTKATEETRARKKEDELETYISIMP